MPRDGDVKPVCMRAKVALAAMQRPLFDATLLRLPHPSRMPDRAPLHVIDQIFDPALELAF